MLLDDLQSFTHVCMCACEGMYAFMFLEYERGLFFSQSMQYGIILGFARLPSPIRIGAE